MVIYFRKHAFTKIYYNFGIILTRFWEHAFYKVECEFGTILRPFWKQVCYKNWNAILGPF